jgi:hypothetical protein
MAPDIGYFAVLLALFISVAQSAALLVATRRDDPAL